MVAENDAVDTNDEAVNPFAPRGLNRNQTRTDGWVGGRADTWAGHYRENPASRASADARRMIEDADYRSSVAAGLVQADEAYLADARLAEAGLTAEPLSPGIGMTIGGVDLAAPSDRQVELIWHFLMTHKVVFFRDQGHISREEHIAFGKRFANVGFAYGRQRALSVATETAQYPEILKLYANEARPFSASNWHSDVTWSNRPPLGSILLSRKSPPVGGDTVFVDAYALWDALAPELKTFLEDKQALHGRAGRDEVAHPVCRTHPVTGKRALYINPTFTNSIRGMDATESGRFLAQLYAKMYSTPEHACRFPWRDGSVAMWDNRACQHYAVGDFWPHERNMERVTLVDPSAVDELPFFEDDDGRRHYSELLTSEESLATPISR